MIIVDGKKIADAIINDLKSKPAPQKFVAAILVGEDPASVSFLEQKGKTAKLLGVDFRLYRFPAAIKNDELRRETEKIAAHKTCGGVIVQLPLPEHINRHYILNVIPREKDLDVLGERALGAFYAGRNPVLPPAVGVTEIIIQEMNLRPEDLRVAVVGLGLLVGRPIAVWLMRKAKELILLHRGSDFSLLKEADLVISGVGKAGLVNTAMLREGAGVIDFGYCSVNGKLAGDFDPSHSELLGFYTPTPGGTGPILVAKLFENFYKLNEERN